MVQAGKGSQLEIEKSALDSIKVSTGILTYEVLESQSKIKGALIQMTGYEILFKCGDDYPLESPQATLRFPSGRTETIEDYWIPGVSNSLAQAVLVIVPQIDSEAK
jgi:hypothetical protein